MGMGGPCDERSERFWHASEICSWMAGGKHRYAVLEINKCWLDASLLGYNDSTLLIYVFDGDLAILTSALTTMLKKSPSQHYQRQLDAANAIRPIVIEHLELLATVLIPWRIPSRKLSILWHHLSCTRAPRTARAVFQ